MDLMGPFFRIIAVSLVAAGSLYKVDPDRIITKKIVLSGHLMKISKRSAVVRYMFFNRGELVLRVKVKIRVSVMGICVTSERSAVVR